MSPCFFNNWSNIRISLKSLTYGIIALTVLACSVPKKGKLSADLEKGFQNPGGTSRPKVYWWWLKRGIPTR